MNQHKKIAVIGGGGRTGLYLVNLLIKQGYALRVLLRAPLKFEIENPLIKVILGDATDSFAIAKLLQGCDAVISTVGQRPGERLVAEIATKNILAAMHEYGIKRYILVAGINIDTPADQKSEKTRAATDWMKINYPEIQEDRQKAYTLLSASAAEWTLVRVPLILFTADQTAIKVNLEDCPGDKVNAANIAAFLVGQLSDRAYLSKSPFIANTDLGID